jgi:hypothetical protein
MREDPYPARFHGRQIDEPFSGGLLAPLPTGTQSAMLPFPQPLSRILLLLLTLYLCCAFALIFAVSSYAAPLGNAIIPSQVAEGCAETVTVAAH